MIQKNRGTTLLELIMAMGIGLVLVSIVLSILQFSGEKAKWQQEYSYVEQNLNFLENYLRDSAAFSQIYSHCQGPIPPRSETMQSTSIKDEEFSFYQYPYRIHASKRYPESVDIKRIETESSKNYSPKVIKQIPNLIVGSDILSITNQSRLSWQVDRLGLLLGSDDHDQVKGKAFVLLLLTNCQQTLMVKAYRSKNFYEFAVEDRRLIGDIFPQQQNNIAVYLLDIHLIYLHKEQDKRVLVHDYLDGQNFIKIPDVMTFNVWFHNSHTERWEREEYQDENILGYHAIVINAGAYSVLNSKQSSIHIADADLFGMSLSQSLVVNNPRTYQYQRMWLINLYNK